MAVKIKYQLKQEKGVLHIGGGRFFYPGKSYELTTKEVVDYGTYFIEEKKTAAKAASDKSEESKE
jgi:hypothetical protein